MKVNGDICSVKGNRDRNEDYALFDAGYGACVADGIGGAPLGDAIARLACHTSMNAMRRGLSAAQAGMEASRAVKAFIEEVDSPGSGAGLMVAKFELPIVELAWYGDLAYSMCREGGGGGPARTNLDGDACQPGESLNIEGGRARNETFEARENDKLIICTDGVWRNFPPERIGIIADEAKDARDIAARLVFGREARDNATALAMTFA